MNDDHTIHHPVLKAASAWVLALFSNMGLNSWADVAAMFAAIYSFLLIVEWIWKRFIKAKL